MTTATSDYLNRPLRTFERAFIERHTAMTPLGLKELYRRHPYWRRYPYMITADGPAKVAYYTDQPGDDE